MATTRSTNLTTVERDGFRISYRNPEEFESIYSDVFVTNDYEFEYDGQSPFIIDAGAHIGLASLFFKQRYPQARIVAVEPNPDTYAILERNIRQNHLAGVRLMQAALSTAPGRVPFYISRETAMPWTWGDAVIRNAWYRDETNREISVPAITLASLLTQPVDLLKLDVEGLETAILAAAAPHLHLVDQIIVEFHGSRTNPTNRRERILSQLRKHRFAYTVIQDGHVIDERRVRADDPYWLIIRARRLTGGRVKRFLGSRPQLSRLGRHLSARPNQARATGVGERIASSPRR